MTSSVVSTLNEVIWDSYKCLKYGKNPLHDQESITQWERNKEAYINFMDGHYARLKGYREVYKDEPFYQMYLIIMSDVMSEIGVIIGFREDWTHPQLLERIEMLLSLTYSVFSSCLGLGNMRLNEKQFPLTPDDMSMYMQMKAEERRTQRLSL